MAKSTPRATAALSSDCAFVDKPRAGSSRAQIGIFRCPVSWPGFRDTGPIERCVVVFPRSAVWIRHEGSRRFLADPTVATIYNRAQLYERFPASPEGDRCDWFAIADDVAREIVSSFDRDASDSERPFRFEWTSTPVSLYLRQRALATRALRGQIDQLECEESVIEIVESVLQNAYARVPRAPRRRAAERHAEIVEDARAYLLATATSNVSVHDIASAIGVSPYHLCRVFRASVGKTLHAYRSELRVRVALERLEDGAVSLSALAFELGFSSHSHLVQAMRRLANVTPGAARMLLQGS